MNKVTYYSYILILLLSYKLCNASQMSLHIAEDFNHKWWLFACSREHIDEKSDNFTKQKLNKVDFSNVQFVKGVNFSFSNLRGANFTNSKLVKANFSHADLTGANFTNAIINGAKFKDAKLVDAKLNQVLSAKGTLIEDEKSLNFKVKKEKYILNILNPSSKNFKKPFVLKKTSQLSKIHEILYQNLEQAFNKKEKIIVFDLKKITYCYIDECHELLVSPFFKKYVARVEKENKFFIIYLNLSHIYGLNYKEKLLHFCSVQLDLHGNSSLLSKKQQIDEFIVDSHYRGMVFVDIITGRGLHNSEGEMGILWGMCQKYLLSKRLHPYVSQIHSINLNGGWRVMLKDSSINQKRWF